MKIVMFWLAEGLGWLAALNPLYTYDYNIIESTNRWKYCIQLCLFFKTIFYFILEHDYGIAVTHRMQIYCDRITDYSEIRSEILFYIFLWES